MALVVVLVHLCASAAVAGYAPTWECLDARLLPAWYDQPKVGIFLHWGVYSVPGYVSEWFWWYWMDQGFPTNKKWPQFMKDNYIPVFTYPTFAKDFTCEFFDPNEWARIFENSDAR
ncbi:alpha-L-fucosidase, putative [Ixodes scapularis]|uniref:alpha-L-fucosidase n=1 Tax=Ixodes scapularis TaxID=6945 RepID=B7PUI1_IXOSC|nr:alpha-L-fucosidase, putative [Ixodes scapularis]|eukprot:XP_002406095.1 alpha-L-fucosidase, putative [Ixodes scapularis]